MSNLGITTKYAGTEFRSRLEARWAYLFDALGWQWEYEPFDAAGYIPDFVIIGARPFLVEVKPDVTLSDLGHHAEYVEEALLGTWTKDVLIVGSTPFPSDSNNDSNWGYPAAGLLLEFCPDDDFDRTPEPYWNAGVGVWERCLGDKSDCGRITVFHDWGSFASRGCGHYLGDGHLGSPPVDLIKSNLG